MASWFTSAMQTVRDKSMDALDFVKRDLTEFTTTVQSDTETLLHKIKTPQVGELVSKLSNTIKKPEDNNEKNFHPSSSVDRIHNELTRLQNDESTYLTDPTPTDAYENWRTTTDFNVETHKGEITQLLVDAPHVRSYYAHLVPAQTTHADFWSRYFYRVHQIEEEEARRTQLLKRAHEICSENDENIAKNNANDWDEPEEEWSEEPTTNIIQETVQQQETTVVDPPAIEKPHHQRSESDTGDSWEREFDETDLGTTKLNEDVITKSEESIPSESLTSSTLTTTPAEEQLSVNSSSTIATTTEAAAVPKENKKKDTELDDDDWESWS